MIMPLKCIATLALLISVFVPAEAQSSNLPSGSVFAYCQNGYVTGLTSTEPDGFTCSDGASPLSLLTIPDMWPTSINITMSGNCNYDAIVVGFLTPSLAERNGTWLYTAGRLARRKLCRKSSVFNLDVLAESVLVPLTDGQGIQCPPNSTFTNFEKTNVDSVSAACNNVQTKSPIADAIMYNSNSWCSNGFFTSLTPDLLAYNGKAQCLWNVNAKSIPPKNVDTLTAVSPVIQNNTSADSETTTMSCGVGEAAFSIFSNSIKRQRTLPTQYTLFKKIFTGERNFYCGQVYLSNNYSLVLSDPITTNPLNVLSFNCENGFLASVSQTIVSTNGTNATSYSYTCATLVPPVDTIVVQSNVVYNANSTNSTNNANSTINVNNTNSSSSSSSINGNKTESGNLGSNYTLNCNAPNGYTTGGNYGNGYPTQSLKQVDQSSYGTSHAGAQQSQSHSQALVDYGHNQAGSQQGQNYANSGSYESLANIFTSDAYYHTMYLLLNLSLGAFSALFVS